MGPIRLTTVSTLLLREDYVIEMEFETDIFAIGV